MTEGFLCSGGMVSMRMSVPDVLDFAEEMLERLRRGLEVLGEEYEKMLREERSRVLVEKYTDEMRRRLAEYVSLIERVCKLRREYAEAGDEEVDRLAYLILKLDERGKDRVGDVVQRELGRMRLEERTDYLEFLQKFFDAVKNTKERLAGSGLGELLGGVQDNADLFALLCGIGEVKEVWVEEWEKEELVLFVRIDLSLPDVMMLMESVDFWWDVVERVEKEGVVARFGVKELEERMEWE